MIIRTLSQEIKAIMPEIYSIVIPAGIRPGDSFQVLLGTDLLKLNCPYNAGSGDKLKIKVLTGRDTESYQYYNVPDVSFIADIIKFPSLILWIMLECILLIFLILSCSLPSFAIQHIR